MSALGSIVSSGIKGVAGGIVSSAIGSALGALQDLITIKPMRGFAQITADAVLEEQHSDELLMTDQPVEQGALITDHAYKLPAEVVLTYGWSLSGDQANGDPQFLIDLYTQLVALQVNRTQFAVFTGKRMYPSMLLKGLTLSTNQRTENGLLVRATCRELLLATTNTTSTADAQNPSPAAQADPAATSPTLSLGNIIPIPSLSINLPSLPSLPSLPKIPSLSSLLP